MNGLMMRTPLTIPSILQRAARFFPEKEIVSRRDDNQLQRASYGVLFERVIRLMNVLRDQGVRPGDRVATVAWNHLRHLELYFAVPSLGAVLHTVNPRLSAEQLRFIFGHAGDRVVFVDKSLAAGLAPLQADLKTVTRYIVMDEGGPEPPDRPRGALDYEHLIQAASSRVEFPTLDEEAAAGLCYTSGTTGDPKGVLYSHRSTYLHAMSGCMVDTAAIGERETVLPVVPMFHVNAWGIPYSCTLAGAKQVYPGSQLLDRPLAELLEAERVTLTTGVPTIWVRLYQYLQQNRHDLSALHTIFVGGAATPRVLIENFQKDYGITVVQGWGMTETSPVGIFSRPRSWMKAWTDDEQMRVRAKTGVPVIGVEVRILGDDDAELPWDGAHAGELVVRGPWVLRAYYQNPEADAAFTADGWFRTGDMATIDPLGYVQITDRKKDLIKRKGEWISSLDMENALLRYPGVADAAVVGRPDDVCGEVPVAFVVPRDSGATLDPAEVVAFLARTFAAWQVPKPNDIRVVAVLPRTGVGKLDKKVLRRGLAGS